ncbi:mce related protein [Nocardioides dokdonensis FR1436]|uniref:Mce related protein n=1 Tax=Nocardioides dokdonensis FR1436 TaxID=1300347 RepID=A0A1A9GNM5_9ACTN|nr:MlaD family protein [Nocardioides dokdonensis]ANH39909.1 mce related protein [Nocardioides dokdonensis FR1436]
MTRGVKIRLLAFVVLSAVGIVYISANYLGLVDRVLGRGITVQATLPSSGGLFEGSEVTYRGVKIGKVAKMRPTREGVTLDLALVDGTELPLDSPMFVHNLSAVGEQYLDFEPADDRGPYAAAGDVLEGSAESMPVDEADLLVELDQFVSSVDGDHLRTFVSELGDLFADTGVPLQRLLDNGQRFISEAAEHTDETIRLLDTGLVVLRTQQGQQENIRSFSRDLSLLTRTLRRSDEPLREVLQGTPGTAREVQALLEDLEPTLPVLLGNAISLNQVVVSHLAGVEQLLVTYPRVISSGFTGTPPDGYGHVNLQLDYSVPPCTEGFRPPSTWRRGDQLSDGPIFPARCEAGPPYGMRGPKYSPDAREGAGSSGRALRSSYDPVTGEIAGAVDRDGNPVRFEDQGDLSVLGGDAWKWLLVGPVRGR